MAASASINSMGRCQLCQQMRATRSVSFHRNVGMLVARKKYSINGELCKPCIHRKIWEFQGKNLPLGPWGYISLVMTPIFLLQNTGTHVNALYKLRDAIE
jgi:hypothetical protein